MWSGLIKDYYIPRMQMQLSDKRGDLRAWEEKWIMQPWINTTRPYDDPLKVAIQMVNDN
jgi:alpha-N-acetylglucosaminidase